MKEIMKGLGLLWGQVFVFLVFFPVLLAMLQEAEQTAAQAAQFDNERGG